MYFLDYLDKNPGWFLFFMIIFWIFVTINVQIVCTALSAKYRSSWNDFFAIEDNNEHSCSESKDNT